ncbi:MAG: ABC transporter ATP-binding protein [Betaproteobacteria bacterium]
MSAAVLLETTGLSKDFGGIHAVRDLTLEVREGEIVGLIGPNGSGKSTLVNLIAGVYQPTSGRIRFRGQEVTGLRPPEMALRGAARTFQSSRPFLNLSVRDNVVAAALLRHRSVTDAQRKAAEVMALTGLTGEADLLATSLPVERRKRLDLARALATEPKLLMLDEVMAGLNPREMEEGIQLVREINAAGVTVIFIEHVMKAVVALCHRVIVLNQGELLAEGAPQDVMNRDEVIRAYLGEGYRHARN